jgi:hypothetical protein
VIGPVPQRTPIPGVDWCYRCHNSPHLIIEADHRPVWPLRPSLNCCPPMPIDNYSGRKIEVPDPVVLADASIVWGAEAEWQEAAE